MSPTVNVPTVNVPTVHRMVTGIRYVYPVGTARNPTDTDTIRAIVNVHGASTPIDVATIATYTGGRHVDGRGHAICNPTRADGRWGRAARSAGYTIAIVDRAGITPSDARRITWSFVPVATVPTVNVNGPTAPDVATAPPTAPDVATAPPTAPDVATAPPTAPHRARRAGRRTDRADRAGRTSAT